MPTIIEKTTRAKPFLKWAGGKGQLIDEIDSRLPRKEIESGQITTYIEPFVGGGAVFFHIAQHYPQFKQFCLIDINQDLINCYKSVRDDVDLLIRKLKRLQNDFLERDNFEERKDLYYTIRAGFNSERDPAKLIFLNKTCYNGLYRVNKNNEFNVPFGGYTNPAICGEENLRSASNVLQGVEIICDDFEIAEQYINSNCFVYLDPPYRPISPTAAFTSYAKDDFTEHDQIRLADFCGRFDGRGAKFLLSNSDPKNEDSADHFFEDHYKRFRIERIKALRAINCKGSSRGQINELIIKNY